MMSGSLNLGRSLPSVSDLFSTSPSSLVAAPPSGKFRLATTAAAQINSNTECVIVAGGNAAGYASKAFVESGIAEDKLRIVGKDSFREIGRRQAFATMLVLCSVPILLTQMPGKVLAEEGNKETENSDQTVLGGLLSLFDPNETTKQGKKLPKAYLKSARDVVQTLRASFSEDSQNDAKFRRNADSAKGAIREYISSWRGANLVDAEDSSQALERVLRGLSEFYSKKGPSAALPEDVRARILEDLQKADDAL